MLRLKARITHVNPIFMGIGQHSERLYLYATHVASEAGKDPTWDKLDSPAKFMLPNSEPEMFGKFVVGGECVIDVTPATSDELADLLAAPVKRLFGRK